MSFLSGKNPFEILYKRPGTRANQPTSEDYCYYEVKFIGGETHYVLGKNEKEIKADFEEQYNDKVVLSVKKVDQSSTSFTTEDGEMDLQAQLAKQVKRLSGQPDLSIEEARSIKTFIGRHITNRKNYQAAHDDVKKGANTLDAARKHRNVDAKELQAMDEAGYLDPKGIEKYRNLAKDVKNKQSRDLQTVKETAFDKLRNAIEEKKEGISKKKEDEFHNKLDDLMHSTFGASPDEKEKMDEGKRGLWDNIHAKRERIKNGSGERMRKPGSKGAPSAKDLRDSQNESYELQEGEDKLMYLARIGLMAKNEVLLLKRALAQKAAGVPMSVKNRDLLLKLMDKMVRMVTGNPHMFNLARRKVMEEIIDEFEDRELAEWWVENAPMISEEVDHKAAETLHKDEMVKHEKALSALHAQHGTGNQGGDLHSYDNNSKARESLPRGEARAKHDHLTKKLKAATASYFHHKDINSRGK